MTSQITLNLNADPERRRNLFPRYATIAAQVSFAMLLGSLALNAMLRLVPAPSPAVSDGSVAVLQTDGMFRLVMDLQLIVRALLLANRFAHEVIFMLLTCFASAMVCCVAVKKRLR